MDTKPQYHFKKWNMADDSLSKVSIEVNETFADLVSSCRYVNGIAWDCGLMSFDIDRFGTADKFIDYQKGPGGKKLRVISKLVLKAIKKNYPELRPYISHVTKTKNDGLSLVIKFPSFELTDKRLVDWFKGLQMRLGSMLKALGLGVDEGAYGLVRDIPCFINRDLRSYVNKIERQNPKYVTRKDADGNPIRNILTELSSIVQRYKSVWDQGKKKNLSQYLYPDLRVERKLAEFYLRSEFKFTQTFHSQKEMASVLGVSLVTLRKMLKNPAIKNWLLIEKCGKVYKLSPVLDTKLFERAKAVMEGHADNPWKMKDASDVMDGERNNYIYRTAVILRDSHFPKFMAARIISELAKKMEGYRGSVNFRRIPVIVDSIYKNAREKKERCPSKLIPGFDDAVKACDAKLGNGLYGLEGGEAGNSIRAKSEKSQDCQVINLDDYKNSKNLKSVKNSESLSDKVSKRSKRQNQFFGPVTDQHFEMLNPKPFKSWYEGKRCFNDVFDYEQKNLTKHIHDELLKPLIDSITHKNSHLYIEGKFQGTAAIEKTRNASRYNHSLSFDIQDYFPSVDQTILQNLLESMLPKQKAQKMMEYVKQGSIVDGQFFERINGIPQGFSWSNKLSTLYLIEFDNLLTAEGFDFVRVSDDYTIYGDDQAALIEKFREIQAWLWNNRKLRINRSKTELDGHPAKAEIHLDFD